MTRLTSQARDRAWERFVVDHGHQALGSDLAFILRRSIDDIDCLRAAGVCSKGGRRKTVIAHPAQAGGWTDSLAANTN